MRSSTAVAAVAKSPVLRLSFWYDQPVPAGGNGDADLRQDLVGLQQRDIQAVEEAVGLDDPLAPRPLAARTRHPAPASAPGGRCRGRRARCRRRSCRCSAPAGRRSSPRPPPAAAPCRPAASNAAARARWSSRRCGSASPTCVMPRRSAIRPRSIRWPGCAKRSFIIGSRLWPPASSLASGAQVAEQLDGVGHRTWCVVFECRWDHRVGLLRGFVVWRRDPWNLGHAAAPVTGGFHEPPVDGHEQRPGCMNGTPAAQASTCSGITRQRVNPHQHSLRPRRCNSLGTLVRDTGSTDSLWRSEHSW